ncbi:MAG: response regulator transcription factor [Anaerolineaceae bacterium]|nr:response regulator transcription factor [Anaerolineaceae bacterium]
MTRVLIVDDEDIARISLAEILRLEGYTIKAVESGEAAVETLRKEPFDVMVLDLKMPGMSGIDVLEAIDEEAGEMKVIVLTAHGSMDTAIQAIRYRVHDYLLKPVMPENIVRCIENAVTRTEEERDLPLSQPKIFRLPGGAMLDCSRREITWDGGMVNLTPTESRLMEVLYELSGQVISHADLVHACQGYRVDNEEAAKILRPVVSRLRQKLVVLPGWDEWIKNIRGAGYVLEL